MPEVYRDMAGLLRGAQQFFEDRGHFLKPSLHRPSINTISLCKPNLNLQFESPIPDHRTEGGVGGGGPISWTIGGEGKGVGAPVNADAYIPFFITQTNRYNCVSTHTHTFLLHKPTYVHIYIYTHTDMHMYTTCPPMYNHKPQTLHTKT